MESKIDLEELLDIILKHAKWIWETETSEAGKINYIFAVIFFVVTIVVFIGFHEELYKFLTVLMFAVFLCYSLSRVTHTEQESRKIRGYQKLKAKYPTKTGEENIESEKTELLDEKSAPSRYKILNEHAIAATLAGFVIFILYSIMDYVGYTINLRFFYAILPGFVIYVLVIFLLKK